MWSALVNPPPPDVLRGLLAGPGASPPPGHISDLSIPNHYAQAVFIASIFALLGGIFFVLLRMYTQHFASRGLDVEDYVMFVALLLHIGVCALCIPIVQRGVGKHMWNISLHDFYWSFQVVWLFTCLYIISLALVKIAILLQFIRIFTPSRINKATWYTCWACIIINALFYLAIFFLQLLECTPVSRAWDRTKPGTCLNVAHIYQATTIFNVLSDFTILAIPIPVILQLNMRNKRKLLVITVFATGVLACVASILRCYYTFRAFETNDLSFYLLWMGLFCTLEAVFGFIIFFMPVASVFYCHMRARFWPAPTSSLSASDLSPDSLERAKPKNAGPYTMPSLASFEERMVSQTGGTIEYMPTLDELDSFSSTTRSKAISSDDSAETTRHSNIRPMRYSTESGYMRISTPSSE